MWEYFLFHSLLFLEAYTERRIQTLKWAHNLMSLKQTSVTKYPILLLQIRDKQVWSLKGIYVELVFNGNHSSLFKQSWYSSRSKAEWCICVILLFLKLVYSLSPDNLSSIILPNRPCSKALTEIISVVSIIAHFITSVAFQGWSYSLP